MNIWFEVAGNKSINGIFVAILCTWIFSLLVSKNPSRVVIPSIFAIVVIIVLLLMSSRSGLIGFICGGFFSIFQRGFKFKKKQTITGIVCFLFIFCKCIAWKHDSSSGRLHIYALSLKVLGENWLCGIGVGKFRAVFNLKQADYFSSHGIDNRRSLIADNTFYAFNEYLQWFIEAGLTGFLTLILMIIFVFYRFRLILKDGYRPVVVAAAGGLVCAGVAAAFSYPLHVIAIQLLTLISVGIILFFPLKRFRSKQLPTAFFRIFFIALAAYFAVDTLNHIRVKEQERQALMLNMAGYKTKSVAAYSQLVQHRHLHGYNYYSLAKALFLINRVKEASGCINKGLKYYADNNVYSLKGQIEIELNQYKEAEESLKTALYMVPNRMTSRYELMKFYIRRGDTASSVEWANSILNMPIKITSDKTEFILAATKDSLAKWKVKLP